MKTHNNKKPQIKHLTNENTIELGRHIASEVADEIKDVGKATVNELWDQLLTTRKKIGGDLVEGEEINLLEAHDKKEQPHTRAEAPINYFREIAQGEKKVLQENEQHLRQQISEIQMEIRRLIESTQDLKVQFKEAVVEQTVEKPGKYHKAFYEWFLSMLVSWRESVEDAGAWMAALHSKKASKKYWSLFKKHGTTFGLSGERNVSQQTG